MPTYSSPWSLNQQWSGSVRPLPSGSTDFTMPLSGSYQSGGYTFQPQQPTSTGYGSAVNTALGGATNWSGAGQPGTNQQQPSGQPTYGQSNQGSDRQLAPTTPQTGGYYGTPSTATRLSASDMYGTPQAQQFQGALSGPGVYENWYQQNATRYNQPTALNSYYQQVSGRMSGQRYQPTTSRDAFNYAGGQLRQPSYGVTNAQGVSGQLRQSTAGEGYMGSAAGMLGGGNQTQQYYGDNRNFFESPGQIEDYYANNGERFQQAGFGENYAQGMLGSNEMQGLYGNRLVGDEMDYFRQPLRDLSYSEQLYESGNQGLNTYYDREREKAQQDLADRMAAMGVFGSGETVQGMTDINAELASQQARDMAGLAGQADQQRLGRAGLAMDFSGAAADEELARGGLMMEGAQTGLQLDRDAISRLSAGGDMANMASRYGLDRVVAGGDLARSADDSLVNQASALGGIGRDMSATEINRLMGSGSLGLDADAETRARLNDYFGMATDVDRLGLDAQDADLRWIETGGRMAGDVDRGNLDWLNAGGDAADLAQQRFEQRERYGFLDPLSLGQAMAGSYGGQANTSTTEQGAMRSEAINLLMSQAGLSASEAERAADEWSQTGNLAVQLAALKYGGGRR